MAEVILQSRNRADLVRRGRYLEYFTISYNSLKGLIAVAAGLLAGSIALVGFGFDSLIEVTSGAVLLWRLHADLDEERRERDKRQRGLSAYKGGKSVKSVKSCGAFDPFEAVA